MAEHPIAVVHIEIEGRKKEPFISGFDLITWLRDIESELSFMANDKTSVNKISQETAVTISIIRESIEIYCGK